MGEPLSSSISRAENLRQRAVNWRIPGERRSPDVTGLLVSDEFCPTLTDPHLLRIARALLDAESNILSARIRAFNKTKADPEASTEAKRATLCDAEAAYAKIEEVRKGTHRVGTYYLKSRRSLHFWTDQYNAWSYRLEDPGRRDSVKLDWHIIDMNTLGDAIVQAATASPLDAEIEQLLEERWSRFAMFEQMVGGIVPKLELVPKWDEIKKRTNASHGSPRSTTPTALHSQSTLIWLVLVTTVSNTITFALSYNYSTHERGAWRDADFWALVQQAITQLIGLAITMVPLAKNPSVPPWAWQAPSLFIGLLTAVSIPLYLFAPTEWSSFTMLVGGAIQTFLTLQLAILGV
ncbi:hypothetical protein SCUCBS95973_003168 [Sporothrix curviconia]|uniref:Uncharacterized protein n=1 Tax=Sporothrix curviconia TaxID=1260050 RepID=A0ABP0BD43_9PEZI